MAQKNKNKWRHARGRRDTRKRGAKKTGKSGFIRLILQISALACCARGVALHDAEAWGGDINLDAPDSWSKVEKSNTMGCI
jgi:hypothetical protein